MGIQRKAFSQRFRRVRTGISGGILHLLFPPKCALCGRIVREADLLLCRDCQKALPYAPAAVRLEDEGLCLTCSAPFYYEGSLRRAFLRYKFEGKDFYAALFGDFAAGAAEEQLKGCWDLVTWAPLNRKRLRARGYDQSRLLAEVVAARLDLPLARTLTKEKNTRPQSSLRSGRARAENARGAYAPAPGLNLEGKRVLLVDDILTTGSTLKECAGVLLRGGAKRVDCAVLARHRPEQTESGEKSAVEMQ